MEEGELGFAFRILEIMEVEGRGNLVITSLKLGLDPKDFGFAHNQSPHHGQYTTMLW